MRLFIFLGLVFSISAQALYTKHAFTEWDGQVSYYSGLGGSKVRASVAAIQNCERGAGNLAPFCTHYTAIMYVCKGYYQSSNGQSTIRGYGGSALRAHVQALKKCEFATGNQHGCAVETTNRCERLQL